MSLTIPQGTVPYGASGQPAPIPFQCWWRGQPAVDLAMPCEIDWGTSGPGPSVAPAVQLNISAILTNQNFGVLQALYVNNVACGVDVAFIFPDTQFKLTVPAGGEGIFPVLSIAANFYIEAPGAGDQDETFFTCLNFVPPPISIQKPAFADVVNESALIFETTDVQLVALGVNGTVDALSISYFVNNGGVTSTTVINIRDGNGMSIFGGAVPSEATGTGTPSGLLVNLSNMNVRFQNGLVAHVVNTGGDPGGLFNIDLYWH